MSEFFGQKTIFQKCRFFGRKFNKNLKNDQIEGVGPKFSNALYDSEKSFVENLENFDIGWESIGNLKYMDAVGREALRLLPSVFFFGRVHPTIKSLGLAVMTPLVNTDCRQWKDAKAFIPERFLDKMVKRHAYSWIPFSAGYRNCVGQRFAQMEMTIVVAYLFKFFKIESLQETEDLGIMPNLIIRPKEGVRVRLSMREDL